MYSNTCKLCKSMGETVVYIGETARSLHERSKEHVRDSYGGADRSHIREHISLRHPERLDKLTNTKNVADMFEIKVLQRHRTSLSRQLAETVTIRQTGGTVLNDQTEYNPP